MRLVVNFIEIVDLIINLIVYTKKGGYMPKKSVNKIKVTAHTDHAFVVDISNAACKHFLIPNKDGKVIPAKHGMKVTHPNMEGIGEVQGVAPMEFTEGEPVLWVKWASEGGGVGYSQPMNYVRV
ncbi:MAG: hypothetical protein Q8Q67_00735 [bacterium]|nr:hypothetical protein [bacterium]